MIQAVMVISTLGKPRLLKFYNFQDPEKRQELVLSIFQLLSERPEGVSNFVETDAIFGPGTKLVYKHLATVYFVFVFDNSENELAMLDLVQVFVETLNRCFKNVCELDIVFNFNKLHTVLDEMILGGQVIETSSEEIVRSVEDIVGETIKHNKPHTKVDFAALQPLIFSSHFQDRIRRTLPEEIRLAFEFISSGLSVL
ncbi:hypothetical protein QYE76_068457 [Lolium multiflorum]|uniref:AP complex mu/sigma subunit domain-containing protein n=1 Tax=Lolium multiflorum TaxID=4521 RepID=A0AAD8SGC3_LOLMU|nr:hypothetical protein QYE76_068457 [Lolium multiflorum]